MERKAMRLWRGAAREIRENVQAVIEGPQLAVEWTWKGRTIKVSKFGDKIQLTLECVLFPGVSHISLVDSQIAVNCVELYLREGL